MPPTDVLRQLDGREGLRYDDGRLPGLDGRSLEDGTMMGAIFDGSCQA